MQAPRAAANARATAAAVKASPHRRVATSDRLASKSTTKIPSHSNTSSFSAPPSSYASSNAAAKKGGMSMKRPVVVRRSATGAKGMAASAHAPNSSLSTDHAKYAATLTKHIKIPLGAATKTARLLETLRDLAKYKPNSAELADATPLVELITKISKTEQNADVKMLALARLAMWAKQAKARDLNEGTQRKVGGAGAGAGAGVRGGAGERGGSADRPRRTSLPPMRLFADVCVENAGNLKACLASSKPSVVSAAVRSLTVLSKYRPKSIEIEAAIDTVAHVKELRSHEDSRIKVAAAGLYLQWKAVMKG